MDISPRMKAILEILLTENEAISAETIANRIGASKRTVQREFTYMNSTLKGYPLTFESKTRHGVWIEGSKEDKEALYQEINGQQSNDFSNRQERQNRLLYELLREKELRKIYYYSNFFGVSDSTIASDLRDIEKQLNEYGLKLLKKPGSGIEIEGEERQYRRAIRAFLDVNIDTRFIRESYEKPELSMWREKRQNGEILPQIFNEEVFEKVIHCLSGINSSRLVGLTESSYVGLVLHIAIAVDRIKKGELIEDGYENEEFDANDEDYGLAQSIAFELEEEFEVTIPKQEIYYIFMHIKGTKHIMADWSLSDEKDFSREDKIGFVNAFIQGYNPDIAHDLKQDDEFIQGLLAHLGPTFVRLKNGMRIVNPALEDVKREYPEGFARCKAVAQSIGESYGFIIPDEEVGFLTIHFGAAEYRLEGKREKLRKVNVGVVCASGIGISRLMLTKIEKNFKGRINITTYGAREITPYIVSKTDFFISSIPLELDDAVIIDVNPLLSASDMERISKEVYFFERVPAVEEENKTNFELELDEINFLAAQIKTTVQYINVYEVDKELSFDAVVADVGQKLSPYDDRSLDIYNAIMNREHISSQIFAEFGFALLHTRTTGVIKPTVSVWRVKDKQTFTSPEWKGVDLAVAMLIPEDDNWRINTELLGHLSGAFVEKYDLLDTLRYGDLEEIKTRISDCFREFFVSKLNRI